jgi:hypothetical protein
LDGSRFDPTLKYEDRNYCIVPPSEGTVAGAGYAFILEASTKFTKNISAIRFLKFFTYINLQKKSFREAFSLSFLSNWMRFSFLQQAGSNADSRRNLTE